MPDSDARPKLVSTVWHSGTHSLIEDLGGGELLHCSPDALHKAKSGDYEVWTTWRDPHRVAASWFNRGRWGSRQWERRWRSQWECYHKIKHYATVVPVEALAVRRNEKPDNTGMHALLDKGLIKSFYATISKELIELAYGQERSVKADP